MKCPFCDGIAVLHFEPAKITFRKEDFSIQKQFYKCNKCKERFTTDELDEVNINQVYNQYREKYQVPFPNQLTKIRERYGLSASKMAEALGFGVNIYRNYENGEIPNASNGTLLNLIKETKEFRKIVLSKKHIFKQKALTKIIAHLDRLITDEKNEDISLAKYLLFKYKSPNEFTGYSETSFDKLFNMVLFFLKNAFFRVRLNKFLFYADFLNFRKTGYSISGVPYAAIDMGPVPENYNTLFALAEDKGFLTETLVELPNGEPTERFVKLKTFDSSLFSDEEIKSMKEVLDKLRYKKTDEIKKMSHDEIGWINNRKKYALISYQNYAFLLKHI